MQPTIASMHALHVHNAMKPGHTCGTVSLTFIRLQRGHSVCELYHLLLKDNRIHSDVVVFNRDFIHLASILCPSATSFL